MPTITVTLSVAAVAKIQAATDAYNQEHGTSLTPVQWATNVLKGTVLQQDLDQAAILTQQGLAAKQSADLATAISTQQQAIMDAL